MPRPGRGNPAPTLIMMSTETQNTQDYRINLDLFEGPLDLLLHLIKKNDLDIANIPIAFILKEYLGYLDLMQDLNIDVAGEFILIAAELTHIKSRLLVRQDDEEKAEEPDPRADLMVRLLEYQKYKRAAGWLSGRPMLLRDVFKRPKMALPDETKEDQEWVEIEPFHLLKAFGEILKRAPKHTVHQIEVERVSITDRIYQIVDKLQNVESLLFEEMFEGEITRHNIVVTFLALLEMGRLRMIQIFQTDERGVIRVRRKMEVSEIPVMDAVNGE